MNPGIDPVLNSWHWEIPFYLFVGGLAAGILAFATFYHIRGKEGKYTTAVKRAPFLVLIILSLGLFALLLELTHKPYFWQLYTNIKFQSPMSWGAWVLMFIMPLSMIWCAIHMKEFFPKWDWNKYKLKFVEDFFNSRKNLFNHLNASSKKFFLFLLSFNLGQFLIPYLFDYFILEFPKVIFPTHFYSPTIKFLSFRLTA